MRPTTPTTPAAANVQGTPAEHAAPRRRLPGLAWIRDPRVVVPLALLALVLLLLPVIHAPFFGDDLTGSEVDGYLKLTHQSLWGVIWESTREAVRTGRPQLLANPIGNNVLGLFGAHAGLYHVYLLLLTALDGALLYILLRRLGWGVASAALPIVLAGGFMQLRAYHDSLISYVGLMQILLALTTGSLILFLRWLREGRRADLVWSVALFVLCPLIYEVTYTFFLIYLGIALTERRGRAALKATAPFFVVCVLFAFASAASRALAPASLEAYNPGGGPWMVLRTFFIQLFPPLPTSYLLFSPTIIGGDPTPAELAGALWRGVAVGGAVAIVALLYARRTPVGRVAGPVALGLGLWLWTPAMLSFAPKYQTELSAGVGYLPVLMQVFGIAILLTVALRVAVARAKARSTAMLALTIVLFAGAAGVAGGVTGFNNLRFVGMIQPDRESRDVLEASAQRGTFNAMPADSSLLFHDSDVLWFGPVPYLGVPFAPMMLADRTGREYDTRLEGDTQPPPALDCPHTPAVVQQPCAALASRAAWVRVRVRGDGGTVIVAPFDAHARDRRAAPADRQITVFRKSEHGQPDRTRLSGLTAQGRVWDDSRAVWRRLSSGGDWAVYTVDLGSGARPAASSLDDPRGVVNWNAMPAPAGRVRLLGVKQILP